MYTFTESTLKILQQACWKPDRQVDITEQVKLLEKEGYVVFPVVREFLSSFAGIRVQLPKLSFDFCITEAVNRRFYRDILNIGNEIGHPLCLIGGDDPYIDFFMDDAGRIYLLDEIHLRLIGDTVEKATETLCRTPNPNVTEFMVIL